MAVTVVQDSYPPVSGTATDPLRLAPAALSICSASVIPYGEATRKLTVYVPAAATSTV